MLRYSSFFAAVFGILLSTGAGLRAEEHGERAPGMLSEKYVEKLDKHLHLKEGQKKKIGAILKETAPRMKKNWAELKRIRTRMKKLKKGFKSTMQEAQERIRETLDYEQREKFDEMRMRRKMLRGKRRGRKGRRGGERFGPDEMRERMPHHFPPERWEEGEGMRQRRELPPEIREQMERRMMRRGGGGGLQRDVPPPEEWDDRRRSRRRSPLFDDDMP